MSEAKRAYVLAPEVLRELRLHLAYIDRNTQPHIHVREQVSERWNAVWTILDPDYQEPQE